jgi:arylsulfatase A-like enzyme
MNGAPMTSRTRTDPATRPAQGLLALALSLGLLGGLLEGVIHIVIQKAGVLENSWYPIVWIAAVFNGALLGVLGVLGVGLVSIAPRRPWMGPLVVFGLASAAFLPWLSLLLKEWIAPYAIVLLLIGLAASFTRWHTRAPARLERRSRRALPWLAAATLAAALGIEGGSWLTERMATGRLPAAESTAPDIVVLIIDTLRADHVSHLGYRRRTTPALDRLASEGVTFENALSTSSYTLPSHASILTGLYPYQHGVEWQTSKQGQAGAAANLPQTLQTLGYRTGAFSANTFWFSREHGFGRGFLRFDDYFHSVEDRMLRTAYGRIVTRLVFPRLGWEDIPARRRAVDVNRAALDWMTRDPDRPSFAVLNYMDAHDPYLPPQPYRGMFASRPDPGGLIHWERHVPERLTPEELQAEIAAYDGGIAYVDAQIDALIATLRGRRARRDLLVVVTSDHGDEFFEHGGFLHGAHLYREVIHVPLIFWSPGRIPDRWRVTTPVTNASIPATILDQLGTTWPATAAPSLRPLWTESIGRTRWPAPLSEIRHRPWAERGPVRDGSLRSLLAEGLHHIEHDTRPPELYDWSEDPHERVNLAGRPDMQAAMARLRLLDPRLAVAH